MGHVLRATITVGLLLVSVGCSTPEPVDKTPPTRTSTVTATTSTNQHGSATAETIKACRALADDRDLANYWRAVANGQPRDASLSVAAAGAIRGLEAYLPVPEVDPTVVAAMKAATDAIAADGTLPARPDEFRVIVSPIVKACLDLDVDMEVQ